MGKRPQLEQEAIRLYAEGMEVPQLALELEVSENSLRAWKKRAGTEWDDARASFRKGQLATFEDVGRRVQRAREITGRITADARNQGSMGLMLNEALQTMVFDLMGQMQTTEVFDPDTMAATIDQIKGLSMTLQRLEQAANLNLKREAEIRRQALEEASKKAADAVDTATGGGGRKLTAEEFKQILRETYGA